jgi:hypothetical protein
MSKVMCGEEDARRARMVRRSSSIDTGSIDVGSNPGTALTTHLHAQATDHQNI